MNTPTITTEAGTRVAVTINIDPIPLHLRSYECTHWCRDPRTPGAYSSGCKCGKCNGSREVRAGTYEGTTYWADNSIEGMVRLDEPANGSPIHIITYVAPNGDCCF